MRRALFVLGLVAALIGVVTAPALGGGRPLTAELSGEAEVPGPGEPDGFGLAHVTLNQGQGEVCFDISVSNISEPLAAHIHVGTADVAGGIVVNLAIDVNGLNGCVDGVDGDTIRAIRQDPNGYYINVHNVDFPAGAVRGQLTK